MTADPDVPRRMAQARHDIDELYELQAAANQSLVRLAGGQRRLTERVEEVQQTLDLHSGRLGRLEEGQRAHTERLDGIDGRLGRVEGQLTEVLDILRAGRG